MKKNTITSGQWRIKLLEKMTLTIGPRVILRATREGNVGIYISHQMDLWAKMEIQLFNCDSSFWVKRPVPTLQHPLIVKPLHNY